MSSTRDMQPYPANESDVSVREIVVGGERVRLVEAGPEGAPVVLLLHGWGASAYNFRHVLPALGASGLRAIAPDLRGHGWSETQVPAGAWSVDAISAWVQQLLDAVGVQRCAMVGQSIGGAVALEAASRIPGRVTGLVLLSPIGFTAVRRIALARAPGVRWWRPTARRWMVSLVMRRIYGVRRQWTQQDVDEYWIPLRNRGVVSALLQSVREFDFEPRDARALKLRGSRLVIRFGELDRLIPYHDAMEHAATFPGADVGVLRGVGHVPAEEAPDDVVEVILRVANEFRARSSEPRSL
jgi:pimeloyl-ACP methyl ester carboxylesterase